jgi:tetratricopeptide (TPR) repeat protein
MTQFDKAPGLMEISTSVSADSTIQKIKIKEKMPEIDFTKEIDEMAGKAKKEKDGTEIEYEDPWISQTLDLDELSKVSEADRFINEAKKLIDKRQYDKALQAVLEALALEPNRQDAVYLKAYCETYLNKFIDALNTLFPIRYGKALLNSEMETSINKLIETIRGRMQTILLIQIDLRIAPSRLIGQLRDLTRLDYDFEFYHFLLSYLLMLLRKYSEAHVQVTQGLELVPEKLRSRLTVLKMDIERRWLKETLRPSIMAYKEGNYNKAKKNLQSVDARLYSNKVYTLFEQHLKSLSRGGLFKKTSKQSPDQIRISGSPKDRELLESTIVSDDIAVGLQLLGKGQIDRAILVFQNALKYTPEYPYLNYIFAGTVLNLSAILLMTKQLGNLESIIDRLKSAQKSAKIALNDKTIEDANIVVKNIEDAIRLYTGIHDARKKIEKEAELVNSLIKEFVDIMETAKGGLTSIEMFNKVFDQMKAVESHTEEAKKQVESEQGKKHIKELETAIRNNMKTLNEIKSNIDKQKKEIEMVRDIGSEYKRIMDSIKGGIESPEQADRIERDLKQLRTKITKTKAELTISQAIEEIEKLDDIIFKNLDQLKKVKATAGRGVTLKEKNFIEEKAKNFKTLMDMLNSGKQIDRQGVEMYVTIFESMVNDIDKEIPTMQSREAKEVIQQIRSNIEGVLNQLRGYL